MPTSKLAECLPDVYRKNPASNNYKLLELHGDASDALRDDIQLVLQAQDLQKAFGSTLNRYGDEIGQPRGNADDALYRTLIQEKIIQNRNNGAWNRVSSGIANLLQLPISRFYLADGAEPHTAQLILSDASDLAHLPGKTIFLLSKIKGLLPAGVRLFADAIFRLSIPVGISVISKLGITVTLYPWQVHQYDSISTVQTAAAVKSCLSVTVLERS